MEELEKGLEEIVRTFLLHETIVKNQRPEDRKDEKGSGEEESRKSVRGTAGTSVPDEEFIANLYECLSERGVLREVHSLLRQRLVEILKGSYPELITCGCSLDFKPVVVVRLLEDFFCTHNLLFTYSVFASEVKGKNESKRDFSKLSSFEAENVLEEVGIPKNSSRSLRILKKYSENRISLLECILDNSSLGGDKESKRLQPCRDTDETLEESLSPIGASSKRIKFVDEEFQEKFAQSSTDSKLGSVDEKYFQLQLQMERDKEAQLKIAMQRFREEEAAKIRDEVETRLKFEFLAKEKELLRNYDDRVAHMKSLLDREKELWTAEKVRKEKELFAQRQDLVRLMEHVKEKKLKLKEAMQRLEHHHDPNESVCSDRRGSKKMDMSSRSEDTDTSSENDRKVQLMKNIQLESAVRRLREENLRLQKKVHKHPHGSRYTERYTHISTDDDSSEQQYDRTTGKNDEDKVALLQYTVEKQAEELESLKQQLKAEKGLFKLPPQSISRVSHKPPPESPFLQDTSLEAFLAESKSRFAEIEKKADVMSSSLKEVFKRSSVSSKRHHSDSHGTASPPTSKPPNVPKLPTTLVQQHSIPSKPVTSSKQTRVRPPKYIPTLGSLEPSLKSFLLSQNEDIFTGGIELPKSSHTRLLTDAKLFVYKGATLADEASKQSIPSAPKDGGVGQQSSDNANVASQSSAIPSGEIKPFQDAAFCKNKSPAAHSKAEEQSNGRKAESQSNKVHLGLQPTTQSEPQLRAESEVPSTTTKAKEFQPQIIPGTHPMQELETKLAGIFVHPGPEVMSKEISPQHSKKTILSVPERKEEQVSPQTTTDVFTKEEIKIIPEEGHSGKYRVSPPKTTITTHPRIVQEPAAFKEPNVHPTSAAASSSGALIQYKVPSPEVSEQDVPSKTPKIASQPDEGSWGDILTPGGALTQKKSSSSDNSMSFPDVSQAEGDAGEFMAEEDFWAI